MALCGTVAEAVRRYEDHFQLSPLSPKPELLTVIDPSLVGASTQHRAAVAAEVLGRTEPTGATVGVIGISYQATQDFMRILCAELGKLGGHSRVLVHQGDFGVLMALVVSAAGSPSLRPSSARRRARSQSRARRRSACQPTPRMRPPA